MDNFAKYLLTALICIVALGQFVQVITRYVLQVPVMGLEETMLYPTLWLYILGSVNASRENTHIRANVLEIFIKTDRGHTILAIIGEAAEASRPLFFTAWCPMSVAPSCLPARHGSSASIWGSPARA